MYYKNYSELYKLKNFYNNKNCCAREYNKNKCYTPLDIKNADFINNLFIKNNKKAIQYY